MILCQISTAARSVIGALAFPTAGRADTPQIHPNMIPTRWFSGRSAKLAKSAAQPAHHTALTGAQMLWPSADLAN